MTAQRIDPDLHPMQTVRSCVAAVGVALDGLPAGDLPGDGRGVDTLMRGHHRAPGAEPPRCVCLRTTGTTVA